MKAQVKGIISCNFRTWKLILGTASFCLEFSLRLHLRVQPLGLEIQELKCCLHCIIMALGIFKITLKHRSYMCKQEIYLFLSGKVVKINE